MIQRAINSVINQTYFKDHPYEIVLVDNNSTDDLRGQVLKYSLNLLNCSVQGVAPALNFGIAHSIVNPKVTHIARLDADDEWLPNKLEIQMKFMEEHNLDICGTGMRFHYENGYRDVLYPSHHRQIYSYLYNGNNPIAHPSVIIKKEVFLHTGGYDEWYKGAEDHDLWVRAINKFKLGNVPQILVNYSLDSKDRSGGDNHANRSSMKLRF